MRYMGSKNKLAKELVPIIQSYITNNTTAYIEPFVGGANIIDKIECKKKVGSDVHKQLIALLNHAKHTVDDVPDFILEDEYKRVRANKNNYEDWYVGLVGFCSSFGARYFDGGYARNSKDDNTGDWSKGAIKNLKKQSKHLDGIDFIHMDFRNYDINKINNCVIYCDPPYKGTKKYSTKDFPYEEFYNWCREISKNNTVLISEYNMPNDFTCIWEKETKANFDSIRVAGDIKNARIERLFIYNK